MEHSTCRSCGAPIVWVVTASGKRMPLDAKPEKRFVISDGSQPPPLALARDTYVSHFSSCPNAAQHRKAK